VIVARTAEVVPPATDIVPTALMSPRENWSWRSPDATPFNVKFPAASVCAD
jgi:hypothetical protein